MVIAENRKQISENFVQFMKHLEDVIGSRIFYINFCILYAANLNRLVLWCAEKLKSRSKFGKVVQNKVCSNMISMLSFEFPAIRFDFFSFTFAGINTGHTIFSKSLDIWRGVYFAQTIWSDFAVYFSCHGHSKLKIWFHCIPGDKTLQVTVTGPELTTTYFVNKNLTSVANLGKWLSVSYKLSVCEFESCCNHLTFRYCVCFLQGVPWHLGNCRIWIHSTRVCDIIKISSQCTIQISTHNTAQLFETSLAKWSNGRWRTKWLWVRVSLISVELFCLLEYSEIISWVFNVRAYSTKLKM